MQKTLTLALLLFAGVPVYAKGGLGEIFGSGGFGVITGSDFGNAIFVVGIPVVGVRTDSPVRQMAEPGDKINAIVASKTASSK